MLPCVVEQHLGAEDIGQDELGRPQDRTVDVRLGGEVDDRLDSLARARDGSRIGDVALEEVVLDSIEVGPVARVGELVEDRDLVSRRYEPPDELRADETCSPGDEHTHGREGTFPRVKRRVVTAAIVVAAIALFTWEWAAAPRVHTSKAVEAQLVSVRGQLYLGKTFEGLPLRRVDPFLYSDCLPGKPHMRPCRSLRVSAGRVTGTDAAQVKRARKRLRRVS